MKGAWLVPMNVLPGHFRSLLLQQQLSQVQLFVGPKDGLFDKVLVDLEEMELGHLQFWYWEVV